MWVLGRVLGAFVHSAVGLSREGVGARVTFTGCAEIRSGDTVGTDGRVSAPAYPLGSLVLWHPS